MLGDDSSKGFTFFKGDSWQVILNSRAAEELAKNGYKRDEGCEVCTRKCRQREIDGLLCSCSICMHIFTSVKSFFYLAAVCSRLELNLNTEAQCISWFSDFNKIRFIQSLKSTIEQQ